MSLRFRWSLTFHLLIWLSTRKLTSQAKLYMPGKCYIPAIESLTASFTKVSEAALPRVNEVCHQRALIHAPEDPTPSSLDSMPACIRSQNFDWLN